MKNINKKIEEPKKGTVVPVILVITYNAQTATEKKVRTITSELPKKQTKTITWLSITGTPTKKLLDEIGNHFDIHPLVLEDIAHESQRPKIEQYDDYLFVILKAAFYKRSVDTDQMSIVVGKKYIITFQQDHEEIFGTLREKIHSNKGKIRQSGSDYLLYEIIDLVVDQYFTVLEGIGEEIEKVEEKLLISADQKLLTAIYRQKQKLVTLHKSIWPTREVANVLQHADHALIDNTTSIYFRDIYDHTIQVVESVETFRDMTSGMLDLYLSTVSNKMNEVMKVLTIFATIFIPLTFVTGLYGMNFEYMPELHWEWGYFVVLGGMFIASVSMLYYFRKKDWL